MISAVRVIRHLAGEEPDPEVQALLDRVSGDIVVVRPVQVPPSREDDVYRATRDQVRREPPPPPPPPKDSR